VTHQGLNGFNLPFREQMALEALLSGFKGFNTVLTLGSVFAIPVLMAYRTNGSQITDMMATLICFSQRNGEIVGK